MVPEKENIEMCQFFYFSEINKKNVVYYCSHYVCLYFVLALMTFIVTL